MIECIKHFGADLEKFALPDLEFLRERRIQVVDPVSSQVGEVPGRVARNIVTRIAKTILLYDTSSRHSLVSVTQSSGKLGASYIRPLIAISEEPSAVVNSQRCSRLQGHNRVQCPTSDDGVQHAVHAASDPAI